VGCGDVVISVCDGMVLIFGLGGSFGNRCAMIMRRNKEEVKVKANFTL